MTTTERKELEAILKRWQMLRDDAEYYANQGVEYRREILRQRADTYQVAIDDIEHFLKSHKPEIDWPAFYRKNAKGAGDE